ncbi:hypothetical protein [Streptomyces sp. NPDC059092]|uniref:hypothetical protein n=1 Tax=Streptomyces sp. NPDC059092 TaxID=3346725 RepID=UPI0036AFC52B
MTGMDTPGGGAGPAAVLFDVDGTVMDTVHLHTVAWREALRQHGHQVVMGPDPPVHRHGR